MGRRSHAPALLALLAALLLVFGPAEAIPNNRRIKKQGNRVVIAKALGIDCGPKNKDCMSATGFEKKLQDFENTKLPAVEGNPALAGTTAVSLYLHEEGAVKQYLFELEKVKESDMDGEKVFSIDASCRKERFALVAQGLCVPTKIINNWMKGKMAPPLDFDFRNDGGPFVAKAAPPKTPHADSKDRRHAVQSMATYMRLHPELDYSGKVKDLLYPVDVWSELDEGQLQKARNHFQMLAKRYRTQLENAIGAGGFDSLSEDQKTLLQVVQEAGLNVTMTQTQEEVVMEAVVDLLSTNPTDAVEERVEEFEEDGSLVVSIIMWTFALAVPIGLLVFLRTRTNLLGKPPAPSKAVGGGTSGGLPRPKPSKMSDSPSGMSPTNKPGALLRQLEEENMRLRQAVVNIPAGEGKD